MRMLSRRAHSTWTIPSTLALVIAAASIVHASERSITPVSALEAVRLPLLLAQADKGDAASKSDAATTDPRALPPEQKKKVKSAVLMLSILSGILLSGLLLIIVAIAVRGLQRKLAGPTRLDREPEDVLPAAMAQPGEEMAPAGSSGDKTEASEETRFT